MDTYIFNVYYFSGEKRQITVKSKNRFSAYNKATNLALKIKNNLELIELEKTIIHF